MVYKSALKIVKNVKDDTLKWIVTTNQQLKCF